MNVWEAGWLSSNSLAVARVQLEKLGYGDGALTPEEQKAAEVLTLAHPFASRRRKWTSADEVRLADLIRGGRQAPEIALLLDRTPYSIQNRTMRLRKRGVDLSCKSDREFSAHSTHACMDENGDDDE